MKPAPPIRNISGSCGTKQLQCTGPLKSSSKCLPLPCPHKMRNGENNCVDAIMPQSLMKSTISNIHYHQQKQHQLYLQHQKLIMMYKDDAEVATSDVKQHTSLNCNVAAVKDIKELDIVDVHDEPCSSNEGVEFCHVLSQQLMPSTTASLRRRRQCSRPCSDAKNKVEATAAETAVDAEVSTAIFKTYSMPRAMPHAVTVAQQPKSPTRYHVLSYIANTNSPLHIRRAGTELQVTDVSGFPLMDVWLKGGGCFFRPITWVLEAYGATVIFLTADMELATIGGGYKGSGGVKGFWNRCIRQPQPEAEHLPLQRRACSTHFCHQQQRYQQQQNAYSQHHHGVKHSMMHHSQDDVMAEDGSSCKPFATSFQQQPSPQPQQLCENVIMETSSLSSPPFCPQFSSMTTCGMTSLRVENVERITVGYLIAGDPFVIQTKERKTVARFVYGGKSCYVDNCFKNSSMSSGSPTSLIAFGDGTLPSPPPSATSHATVVSPLFTYQCLLEASAGNREFARLEVNVSQPQLVRLRFADDAHVLAAAAAAATDIDEEKELDSITTFYQHRKQRPYSNPQFAVQLKLLVLAAAVRMAAAISSPSVATADTTTIMKQLSVKNKSIPKEANALHDKAANSTAIVSSTKISTDLVMNHSCCTIV